MTLAADVYLEHLRAYVNSDYVMHNGVDGKVVLAEKYFLDGEVKARKREIELLLPGPGMAFKLDHEFGGRGKKVKPPLFHFLDDNGKPWSKRCDFVVFYVYRRHLIADCIEFKSGSIAGASIREQLQAGCHWVKSLKRTIEHYTSDTRKIKVRKFVFGDKADPAAYVDANGQLNADPSVRYFRFDEVNGQSIAALHNSSMQEV